MSASKDRGTRFESAIVTFLQEQGWPHAERRALNGARDKGDITGIPGLVIEAKSAQRYELGEWMNEVQAEVVNAGAELGVVWAHRRGKASAGAGYVLMDGETFTRLLKAAGW